MKKLSILFLLMDIVWNPTGDDAGKSFWNNLLDVMRQKATEKKATMSLDDFTRYWIKAHNLPDYPENSPEYQAYLFYDEMLITHKVDIPY